MIDVFAEVAKTFRFEAAHHLPNHGGKCARPHGHSYRAEISAHGAIRASDGSPEEGMVLDFDALSALWKGHFHPVLDHQDLNDLMPVPTAENLAAWIGERLTGLGLNWSKVTVWETDTNRATVHA